MVFSLLFFVSVFVVIGVVFSVILVMSKKREGDVVKQIYWYLISFVTLMMVIGGSVSIFTNAADLVVPDPYYQSFSDFAVSMQHPELNGDQGKSTLDEAELRRLYDQSVEDHEQASKQRAKSNLIKSLGWIIIPLPIFLFTQRAIRREKQA